MGRIVEYTFLGLSKDNLLPKEPAYTPAGKTTVNAFVIQDLFWLKETINDDEVRNQFLSVQKYGTGEIGKSQRSTHYVQRKDQQQNIDYDTLFPNGKNKNRTFCFAAKLAAPYVIALERTDT